jgi:hypothetical protein
MRVLIAAVLAVSLSATGLMAADATGPLASGQAAGVKKAQNMHDTLWRITLGAAAIGIIALCVLPQSATTSTATTS